MLIGKEISAQFSALQLFIVAELEKHDAQVKFTGDFWDRSEGGGGYTMTALNGRIIEKGGVAFSEVHGEITQAMKTQMGMKGESFMATGVSIVLHSKHPFHPTIHMNVRYFETNEGEHWFGGGIDLTPIYIHERLAAEFHMALKALCDEYDPTSYLKFKRWADDYFFLPHRNETRGVGGIFFDHITPKNTLEKENLFNFCLSIGRSFPTIYKNQTLTSHQDPSSENLEWQALRRSRYVEYNLLFDRGTKFGIVSNGRTESILLSMPPMAQWKYNHQPHSGSQEEFTIQRLKKDVDWISLG